VFSRTLRSLRGLKFAGKLVCVGPENLTVPGSSKLLTYLFPNITYLEIIPFYKETWERLYRLRHVETLIIKNL